MKNKSLKALRELYAQQPNEDIAEKIQGRQRAAIYRAACKYVDAHKLGESNTFAGAVAFVELVYNSDKAPEVDSTDFEIPSKYTRAGWGARKVYFD